MRRALSLATFATVLGVAWSAGARPQWSASTQLGVIGLGDENRLWQRTRADLGLRLEGVFFRESPTDFGLGPYVEARTSWFHGADYGGGLIAVLPVAKTYPFWVGGGAFGRRDDAMWSKGWNAFLAWGGRDYNYDASYGMAVGLLLDLRHHGGDERGTDLIVALSVDLEPLMIPVLYTVSAITH